MTASEILKRFDDTEQECEGCRFTCESNEPCLQAEIATLLGKLAYYEKAEAEGRLIKLPCVVGDTVYVICRNKVFPVCVVGFSLNRSIVGNENPHLRIILDKGESPPYGFNCDDNIGKTIFLTRTEAETKMTEGKSVGGKI